MIKGGQSYQGNVFQWRALSIQCGICFSSIPVGTSLLRGVLLRTGSVLKLSRKDPPEHLLQEDSNESKSESQVYSSFL